MALETNSYRQCHSQNGDPIPNKWHRAKDE